MAETRKLAAILAADVAGYSKLAGADEERTLARLRALRSDLIDPTIALHHGRVVKRTGDGILVEFRSVVDAVRCAIEVQNGMVERNAGLPRRDETSTTARRPRQALAPSRSLLASGELGRHHGYRWLAAASRTP
jgi:class 3 adenylate cyclase